MDRCDDLLKDEAVRHLQNLLRLDTTNPPGNEILAARYVKEVLEKEGIDVTLYEPFPGRGNVVARLKATAPASPSEGDKGGPLLLVSHLDVVPAERERWKHDPFSGDIAEGFIWGRGAVDMKNMTALSLACLVNLKRRGVKLRRDVVLVGVADEEQGSEKGARWMVAHEPEAIRAEWAICEVGGFTIHLQGKRVYPIQHAERGIAWLRLVAEGPPGHGSMPRDDTAVLKLARAVSLLESRALPVHICEAARDSLDALGAAVGGGTGRFLRLLGSGWLTDFLLKRMPPERARAMNSLLRNTVTPTCLQAGTKENVIPSRATAVLDGRVVPGCGTQDLIEEVKAVLGDLGAGLRLEIIREAPPNVVPRATPFFDLLARTIAEHDPGSSAVPCMISGFTDAQPLAMLGIKTYGFAPVMLPEGLDFGALYHGHDERIPVDGFRWGLSVLCDAVDRFCVVS